MNRVISALHTVKFADRGLAAYGKPGNYFERQIGRWSKQYVASIDGAGELSHPIEAMDQLMAWLPANICRRAARDESMVSIVHGDYRLDNLMFHPTEPRVLAVLDWELSTLGHPLADFSYHCMAWHIPPGSFRGIGGAGRRKAWAFPQKDEYIRLLLRADRPHHPRGPQAPDWNFYLAYNLFRLAAILQGIAKRVETGTASSAQAVSFGPPARAPWPRWPGSLPSAQAVDPRNRQRHLNLSFFPQEATGTAPINPTGEAHGLSTIRPKTKELQARAEGSSWPSTFTRPRAPTSAELEPPTRPRANAGRP